MKREPQTPPPGAQRAAPVQQQHFAGPHVSYNAGSAGMSSSGISRENLASNNPYRLNSGNASSPSARPSSSRTATPEYKAPPGPPPGWRQIKDETMDESSDNFSPPPGPPPGYHSAQQRYQPPAGPPPSHENVKMVDQDEAPPDYDPWHGGPDDTLRLPPSFDSINPKNLKSPTANAAADDAERAHIWCRHVPLFHPTHHSPQHLERIRQGDLSITLPPETSDITNYQPAMGKTYIRTFRPVEDTILLSDLPVFASQHHSPMVTGRPETIYFELRVMSVGARHNSNPQAGEVDSGIAIGFVAPPYPAWRLPGWQRASLGVHGDDGRRYVDNTDGGIEFTQAFKKGDVVGIGMTFKPPVHGDTVSMRADVFFTRNGKRDGGWDLHEERDRHALGGNITGLEGEHDLLAAVGIFGECEFEVIFRREDWLFRP